MAVAHQSEQHLALTLESSSHQPSSGKVIGGHYVMNIVFSIVSAQAGPA